MKELENIQKDFFWKNSTPQMKQETLCNDYKVRGLKNVDIPNKVIALQFPWIRRLYDNFFHEQKMIPLYLIEKSFGISFKFRSVQMYSLKQIKPIFCYDD